ncbi:hypothetical protein VPR01S_01_00100 [Vibrio proteolyticus NBRC 13287]|uniref:Uncharacterized protein n=1 Tax=Vibrio proteolyticus NBRC 13287 TaxID=1219065 RepID=U2ZVW4_VIBPR|nr:hypothetical protein VPR01S_01_00100 [Vibrio proteolyticus NBRC 13287]
MLCIVFYWLTQSSCIYTNQPFISVGKELCFLKYRISIDICIQTQILAIVRMNKCYMNVNSARVRIIGATECID